MSQKFNDIWTLHNKWTKGVTVDEVVELHYATLYFSKIPGSYTNFVVPNVHNHETLNLKEIQNIFQKHNEKPSFYLLEEHQLSGFDRLLAKHNFDNEGDESWMLLDTGRYQPGEDLHKIVLVNESNFSDYYLVQMAAFNNYPGMKEYLAMCKKPLNKNLSKHFDDFISELLLIYDNGQPAAGAGLFYSLEGNFAYLHSGATREEFRRHGFQTALLSHRIQKALKRGISTIYTLVAPESQSYKNCLKLGFTEIQRTQFVIVREDI